LYSCKILKQVEPKEWNQNLLQSDYSTFFQTHEYLNSKDPNKFPKFILVTNEKNEIVGQLGVIITKVRSGYSTKFLKQVTKIASKLGRRGSWVSGPIIFSDQKEARLEILHLIINALDKIAQENNLMIIDGYSPPLDLLIDKDYKEQFRKNGYKIENFVTLMSSLHQSIDDLWSKVKKSARNDVTKAKRENITVKEINDKIDLINYKKLTQKWAKTKGIEINSIDIGVDWGYLKSGIQNFFLAYHKNEILAGLKIGVFNKIAYTHQVLNSYSTAGNVAGPLLSWHAIEWAKKQGINTYDFSGGEASPKNVADQQRYDEQWKNLFAYKRKWGGEEFPYYHFIKITNKERYKLFRILTKPDWIVRNYKKKHFKRPYKERL